MPGQDVGPALVAFLRELLGVRELSLAEPATPLSGGFDTSIYAIRLRDAPALFAGPLVLRIMAPHGDPAAAIELIGRAVIPLVDRDRASRVP